MDSILMTMFAAVVTTMTALTFVEVRRIRKKLERTAEPISIKRSAA
jgi:hypothetical protein